MGIGATFTLGFDGQAVKRGLDMLKTDVKVFGKSAGSISGAFQNIGKNMFKYISGGLIDLASKVTALFTVAIPAAIGAGVVALGKAASNSASELETMLAQYEIFTGSAEKAQSLFSSLREIAVKSPLELKDIAESSRLLLAMGVSQEKVARTTDMLSEISAGNAEVMGRLAYAFGQINSLGRLTGTELRQLTETGFNPLEFIMKRTGETMDQVRKRMEDGGVSVKEVEMAMEAATSAGGRFYGLNEKMSRTFSGQVSMMKDQWNQLTATLGEGLNEGLKVAMAAITTKLPEFKEQFSKIGKSIGDAIKDAVQGDYDKLEAIGYLIGDTIIAAAKAAFQKGIGGIVPGFENTGREIIRGGMQAAGIGRGTSERFLPNIAEPSFRDLLDANMQNAGIRDRYNSIIGNNPQAYSPSAQSPFYSDTEQRRMEYESQKRQFDRMIELLEKQAKAGPKI